MFEFLGRGKAKSDRAAADAGPSTMAQTVQLSATQREMVRMTLHGVLKLNGIPGSWVTGEVIPVRIPGQGEALLIQLEVLHWHDALVLHAPVFQKELLDALIRFDPQTQRTRYLFAWRFAPYCGCPNTQMPDPATWNAPETAKLGPVAASAARSAPRPRPAPLSAPEPAKAPIKRPPPPSDDDDDNNGFASTQLNDLR
jgi:hypothetical protein